MVDGVDEKWNVFEIIWLVGAIVLKRNNHMCKYENGNHVRLFKRSHVSDIIFEQVFV